MTLNLHEILYLYQTPDKFYIQPVQHEKEAIIIDRQTCEISHNSMFSVGLLPANATSTLIYGVIGIKHLINCPYLIVISRATLIGYINKSAIYHMDQAEVIPFNNNVDNNDANRTGQKTDWNSIYVSMLESVLKVPNFYFSYSYDLTSSAQKRHYESKSDSHRDSYMNGHAYDRRFLWNGHMMEDFDKWPKVTEKYKIPLIFGFVSINGVSIGYSHMNWTIVSRRSCRRAGTRFNSRGIDKDGNVSNFVETEQIIEDGNTFFASFVQCRGSIPLFWSQIADYRYKPAIELNPHQDHDVSMRKHFDELITYYGKVSVVNLIDHKGHEGRLEREFSQRIGQLQKHHFIPYHYFDFHKECSKMRWHRLSILLDQLEPELDANGFYALLNGQQINMQKGVIRSNCIDSLDRTNVVQSMIAQRVLEQQLVLLKIIPDGTRLTDQARFMSVFKNVWADNADALSIQYSGTPALKTDFTRTGRRTHSGLVNDGLNSLTRYVKNNFLDSFRQDSIDLLLGNFEGYPPPLYRPLDTSVYSTLSITIVVITLLLLFYQFRFDSIRL